MTRHPRTEHSAKPYLWGFVLSIVCTLAAYVLVVDHLTSAAGIIASIVVLAIAQLFIQLGFFLHLGSRDTALNRVMLGLALVLVGILVVGSLWIMYNLNARMMPSQGQMLQYMQSQDSM